jgi:hypothetical protein
MVKSERRIAWVVLGLVLAANAAALSAELRVGRLFSNDSNLHVSLVKGMVRAAERGENPLDFWSGGVSYGSAPIRTYQPLAHLAVTAVYFGLGKSVPLETVFLWVRYLAVVLLPAGFFGAALLLELPPLAAAASAVLAPLISTHGWYGLDYSSYLTSGRGLFPQSVAAVLLLWAIGCGYRAVVRGRHVVLAGIALGLTAVCHFIYGWIGAVSLCLLAVLPEAEVGRVVRIRRTAMVGCVAVVLSAFQLLPVWQDRAILNHSRWEGSWKWDSFGAGTVMKALVTGELLDHGRLAVLSLLALVGAALLCRKLYQTRALKANEGFVLAGAIFWLLIFFGRPTWGVLLVLVGATRDLHLHRVVGAVQVFLVLLAAMAMEAGWRELARRGYTIVGVLLIAAVLAPMVWERADYLSQNDAYSTAQLKAVDAERGVIDASIANVKQAGGRVYAGNVRGWGPRFGVGGDTYAAFLNMNLVPQVSDRYHNIALTADLFPLFDEGNAAHYRLFNVRSVVAPVEFAAGLPGFLGLRTQIGREEVFNAPGAGYFDIVDVGGSVAVDRDSFYAVNEQWLRSDWVERRAHLKLDLEGTGNTVSAVPEGRGGEVKSERQVGEEYSAELAVARPSFVLFRMTWHPNWVAYVDGKVRKTAMLSPGFTGVAVSPGESRIEMRYEPGMGKVWMACAGLLAVLLAMVLERRT